MPTSKKYYTDHKQQIIARNKVYKAKHPEKTRYSLLKCNAKSRGFIVTLSKEAYEELTSLPCFYCGGVLPLFGAGLDRIDSDLGYVPGNVRPCCTECNRAKNNMTELKFKEWALRLYSHWVSPTT